MPVVGLPTTLEVALDALLQQNHPTSWKITGEGDSTVVVIRLKTRPASDNMASQPAPVTRQYYRKKPPSQVNRDRRRAEERRTVVTRQDQEVKANEQLNSEYFPPLFAPTPPTSHPVSHRDTTLPQNNTPPREGARELQCVSTDVAVLDIGTCSDQCSTDLFMPEDTTENDGDDPLEQIGEAGYSVSVIQDYVGELTDRSLQRNLRDVSRNEDFCNVFTTEDSPDTVICESEDVIFQFDWTTASDKPTAVFWFFKRDRRQMTQKERAIHSKLLLWTPADRETMEDRIGAGLEEFHVIVDAVRFLLGDCGCG